MMVTFLGSDWGDAQKEINDTRGCHARFSFLETLCRDHLEATLEEDGDDARVVYHRGCVLRAYLMVLVDMSIFVDKNITYIDVIYLRYYIYLERVHEYNNELLVWFTST